MHQVVLGERQSFHATTVSPPNFAGPADARERWPGAAVWPEAGSRPSVMVEGVFSASRQQTGSKMPNHYAAARVAIFKGFPPQESVPRGSVLVSHTQSWVDSSPPVPVLNFFQHPQRRTAIRHLPNASSEMHACTLFVTS